MKRVRYTPLLILACLAWVIPSWVGAQAEPTVVASYFRDLRNLDPAIGPGSPDQQLITNIFSGLVRYQTGSTDVEPDAAERWEISDDGRVYTFFLRDGIEFHRGYGQLTASDVKFSIERILDPETSSRWRTSMSVVESVEVVDDLTVQITLKEPSAPFLTAVLAFIPGYIVSQRAVEELGEDFSFNPIGSGPYMFVSYTPRQEVVLEANPDHFRGPPEVQRVIWKIVPDATVQALAMQRDEVNYMIIRDVEVWQTLKNSPGVAMTETPTTGYWYYVFNTRREPLDDVRVRRAIAHAVDKQLFVDAVLEGQGVPTDSVISPGMFGHNPDVVTYEYDPDRARQLLAEAGYPDGFAINIVYNARGGFSDLLANVMQQWLAEVGVEAELVAVEAGAWTARRQAGDYDITISGITRADPDQILSEQFHSNSFPPNGINQSFYAEVDDLVEAQRTAVDREERARVLAEIQARIAEDVPELPMFQPIYVIAYRDYISGQIPNTSNWLVQFETLHFDLDRCGLCSP